MKVKCINNDGFSPDRLKLNRVYEVADQFTSYGDLCYHIKDGPWALASRFEVVPEVPDPLPAATLEERVARLEHWLGLPRP